MAEGRGSSGRQALTRGKQLRISVYKFQKLMRINANVYELTQINAELLQDFEIFFYELTKINGN